MACDYATLVGAKSAEGSIKSWANHGLAPSVTILTEAQALIYGILRVREMRSDMTNLALSAGDINKALPSDFLDPIAVWDQYQCKLTLKNEADIQTRRAKDSNGDWVEGTTPTCYAIFGEKFQFDIPPDADITLNYLYYFQPPDLSSGTPTNFLTRRYPHLLRRACMVGVYDFLKRMQAKQDAEQDLIAAVGKIAEVDDFSRRGEDGDAEYRA